MSEPLTHFDADGHTRMVDVSDKAVTKRTAMAEATLVAEPTTIARIQDGSASKKGDVLEVARLAGIMATKRTADLIPLCHPLPIEKVSLELEVASETTIHITATAAVTAKTGVEMEALTAASVAALTIYDMCKAIDQSMQITDVRLLQKTGGRRGTYVREPA